jgi:GT2 family glycosyltransferase
MNLSVCILNYNTADLTSRCIESVLRHTAGLSYEIIVVDNASTDGSSRRLREFGLKIRLIENNTNRYFTGGFNDAFFSAVGEYVVLMNSDSYLRDNALLAMHEFMSAHPDVGAAEGTVIDERVGGRTRTSTRELTRQIEFVRRGRLSRRLLAGILRRYEYGSWDRSSDRDVEVICNAFMITPTRLIRAVGGFEEAMKLYYTENYYCDILRLAGYRLVHLTDPQVIHLWSSSVQKLDPGVRRAIYLADSEIYFQLKRALPRKASLLKDSDAKSHAS